MPSKQKSPDTMLSKETNEKLEIEIRLPEGDDSSQERVGSGAKTSSLILNLSATLLRKLTDKAQVEGVSVHDFASELLAEGLVLRAWEIVEKKSAMRGMGSQHSSPQPNNSYRGGGSKPGYRNNQNSHVKRMPDSGQKSRQSYKNIMEDNANFLEYVRSQEKRDRY